MVRKFFFGFFVLTLLLCFQISVVLVHKFGITQLNECFLVHKASYMTPEPAIPTPFWRKRGTKEA